MRASVRELRGATFARENCAEENCARGAAYSLPLSVRGMKLSAYSRARFSDGLACSTRPSRKKSWIRRAALSCRSPRTCFRAIRPRQLRWMTRLHQLRVKRTSTDRRRCSVWIVRAAECRVSAGDDASGGGDGADEPEGLDLNWSGPAVKAEL